MNKNSTLRDGRSANRLLISPRWLIRGQHLRLGLICLATVFTILYAGDRSLAAMQESEFAPSAEFVAVERFVAGTLRSFSATVRSISSLKQESGRVTAGAIATQPNKTEGVVATDPRLASAEMSARAMRSIAVG